MTLSEHANRVVTDWIASLVLATFGGLIGSLLTLHRTKQEARWRAKFDSYQEILRSVEDVRSWVEETYANNLLLPSVSQARRAELFERYERAKQELRAFATVGGLVVSPRMSEGIDALLREIGREEFRWSEDVGPDEEYPQRLAHHADSLRTTVADHLPELLRIARRDLT